MRQPGSSRSINGFEASHPGFNPEEAPFFVAKSSCGTEDSTNFSQNVSFQQVLNIPPPSRGQGFNSPQLHQILGRDYQGLAIKRLSAPFAWGPRFTPAPAPPNIGPRPVIPRVWQFKLPNSPNSA